MRYERADRAGVRAKFHYTDPTGPARTLSATRTDPTEFRPKKSPCGSGRVRVVEFSYKRARFNRIARVRTRTIGWLAVSHFASTDELAAFGVDVSMFLRESFSADCDRLFHRIRL